MVFKIVYLTIAPGISFFQLNSNKIDGFYRLQNHSFYKKKRVLNLQIFSSKQHRNYLNISEIKLLTLHVLQLSRGTKVI